jgi:hypothetical protein
MKKIKNLIPFTMLSFLFACSNDHKPEVPPPTQPTVTQDHAAVDSSQLSKPEWDEYRTRINNRISELESNLAERKALRNAEKDVKKQKEYDVEIGEKEKRKTEFQQKLDNFEARTKEGWEKFKAELDDLFNRDEHWTKSDAEQEKAKARKQEKEKK